MGWTSDGEDKDMDNEEPKLPDPALADQPPTVDLTNPIQKGGEAENKPPHSLAPPTHAAGYRPPTQTNKPDAGPSRVNPQKLPQFYFSGNVEIISDGNGNVTLNFKQH